MSIALVGISAFQIYWISNVIKLSEEQFEKDALTSMQLVVDRLERNEMVNVAANSFAFFGTSSEAEDNNVRVEQEIHVTATKDSVNGKFWYRSNSNQDVKVIVHKDSSDEIHEFVNDTSFTTIEVKVVDGEGDNPEVARRINTKQRVLTKVVEEMMFHEVRQPNRVHPVILDSMLRHEFSNQGIHIRYEFGIYDLRNDNFKIVRASNQSALKDTPLQASLFPNDIINNGLSLMVSFPGKNRFLLEKVWLSLLISLVFILTIIAVFAFVVYKIIHQKKLSDLKNDFINNMTHEFKTPLATVSLATEALNEQAIQQNVAMRNRYLEVIREESNRLSDQVEKVLQLATIEKEELTLDKHNLSINDLVGSAAERARFQVEEQGGELMINLLDNDVEIYADQNHFANAVFNLLDNAIKYSSESPQIKLELSVVGKELSIAVSDKGIGLNRDEQRQIFDKFYRVPTGNLHDVKGFGLGLNYVKYMVEAHQGKIDLDSAPGEGSTFTITLNLETNGS